MNHWDRFRVSGLLLYYLQGDGERVSLTGQLKEQIYGPEAEGIRAFTPNGDTSLFMGKSFLHGALSLRRQAK